MRVMISIPAYNEERTLPRVLKEINDVMRHTKHQYTIQVVNDGSTDKTAEVARKGGAKVISHKQNKGLAETFKTEMKGFLQSKASAIVHTDADGQYPASYIPALFKKVEEGYDLVLGSRFYKSGKYSGSFLKHLGNRAFAKTFSNLLKLRLTDTTTGFRAFNRDVAALPLINHFTYTQEQLLRAGKRKMRITEIPILTRKTRPSRLFSNPFSYATKAWLNILRIYRDFEPLRFFGLIGVFLFAIGLVIGIYMIKIHFTVGITGHLGLLFLLFLLITSGLQIMLFGFLADMVKR